MSIIFIHVAIFSLILSLILKPTSLLAAASGLRISLIHLRKAMADAAMDEDQLQLVWAPSNFFPTKPGIIKLSYAFGCLKKIGEYNPQIIHFNRVFYYFHHPL